MRKLVFLFVSAILLNCSCSARPCIKDTLCVIEPTDSVKAMLGDSVCNAVFHAPEVKIYSVAQPGDTSSVKKEFVFKNRRSIVVEESDSVSVSVDSLFCDTLSFSLPKELNCPQTAILRFVLSAEKMYVAGDNWPSVPFMPDYMIEFSGNDVFVQMVISLSGGMFKIYDNCEQVAYVKYSDEFQMMHFLSLVTDDEFLREMMKM